MGERALYYGRGSFVRGRRGKEIELGVRRQKRCPNLEWLHTSCCYVFFLFFLFLLVDGTMVGIGKRQKRIGTKQLDHRDVLASGREGRLTHVGVGMVEWFRE